MKRSIAFKGKLIPVWLLCCLLVPLTVTVVYAAVTVETTTYGTIGGEVVTVTENLTPAAQGIDVEDATIGTAVGDTQVGAVEMTIAGSVANTTTTAGNYIYVYRLTVATADDAQEYSVELIRDGTSVDTLYCEQPAAAATAEYIDMTWDIGASLSSSVYEIEVLEL